MIWNSALTIAIVEKDIEQIEKLIDMMPLFIDVNEAVTAQALLQEALNVVSALKDETNESMQKIKKTRAFLLSSDLMTTNKTEYRG